MNHYVLEVCVDSVESAIAATNGGATRIELCSNIIIGGTTPDLELFKIIRNKIQIPINVMIRPRFGDFCYTESEFEIMCRQSEKFAREGANAIVIGCLNPDGSLNEAYMKEIMNMATGCRVTLHRAYDMCKNPFEAFETARKLGVDTILTSGQKNSCIEGAKLITGAKSFHMTGKVVENSKMEYRNDDVNMGISGLSEYEIYRTDENNIRKTAEMLKLLK